MNIDNIKDIVKRAVNTDVSSAHSQRGIAIANKTTAKVTQQNRGSLFTGIEPANSAKKTGILEQMQNQTDLGVEAQKNYLAIMSNTMTGEDFQKLKEEGYSLSDTDVEQIVTVVDEIRIRMAAGGDTSVNLSDIDEAQVQAVVDNAGLAVKIAKHLKQNQLPVTKENLKSVIQAYEEGEQITPLSENAMKYMIENRMEPTIQNLYRAEFSSPDLKTQGRFSYYTDSMAGYYAKKATEINFDKLRGKMEEIIESAGLESNSYQMGNAKWLVENDIPLTEESLLKMNELRGVMLPQGEEQLIKKIVNGMIDGREPKDALLLDTDNRYERAIQAVDCINTVSEDTLRAVADSGKPVTIEQLQKQQNSGITVSVVSVADTDSFITAKRQLEEVRLLMTVEASAKMLKQGIQIETTPLAQLVEQLKTMEQEYYQKLFADSGVELNDDNLSLYKDTTTKVSAIADMPSYALGRRAVLEQMTVNQIYEEGRSQKARLDAAGEAYETMMTKPRSDMGDSLRKAFRNVDAILDSLKLEKTTNNERAVRILAYNQMNITEESVTMMKQADMAMNRVMKNMTPQVTLELIREGQNPLDMDIQELNRITSELYDSMDNTSDEKYSEFLWKLQKNDQITQDERNAYINVYRLFHQMEKSENRVLGALLNQGADITMRNLITGTRNYKAKSMDVVVDDTVASFAAQSTSTMDMMQAIETGFDKNTGNKEQQNRQTYYESLVHQALEQMAPEKMAGMNIDTMSLEGFADAMLKGNEDTVLNAAYQNEQMAWVEEAAQSEDRLIKTLLKYDQPVTVNNILSAGVLMNDRGSVFKQLMESASRIPGGKDRSRKLSESFDRITDRLVSKDSAEAAYQDMIEEAEGVVEDVAFSEEADLVDIRSLKMLHKELQLAGSLSREENYEIPMFIQSELTSVNVKIIRGSKQKGTTVITMETEIYGKVAARFTVDKERITGLVVGEEPQFLDKMKEKDVSLRSMLNTADQTVRKMNYAIGRDIDLNQFEENIERSGEEGVTTESLYRISKTFLMFVKDLEQ